MMLVAPVLLFAVKHDAEHDCMLVSLPKSGSSFFAALIAENNPNVRYHSEQLTRMWGGTPYCKYVDEGILKGLYNSRFPRTDLNFTKEVYLSLHMSLFRQRFTLFCLYRSRKYTFPTDRGIDFAGMFDEFVSVPCPDSNFEKIRNYVKKQAKTELQKQLAIHTVLNYIMVKDAVKYNVAVIDYKDLMELSGQDLYDYLQEKVPGQLFTEQLAQQLEEKRFEDEQFLLQRAERYQQLGIESFVQDLLGFIKQLDPEMQYWYLFE